MILNSPLEWIQNLSLNTAAAEKAKQEPQESWSLIPLTQSGHFSLASKNSGNGSSFKSSLSSSGKFEVSFNLFGSIPKVFSYSSEVLKVNSSIESIILKEAFLRNSSISSLVNSLENIWIIILLWILSFQIY